MENQPRNPEFRNYLENFHPCTVNTIKATNNIEDDQHLYAD